MYNTLGKTLVFVNLTISLLAMSWAAAIFLQFVDWGWKEPRKYLDERLASEYDKRAAALAEAHRSAQLILPRVVPAQTSLGDAEKRFPSNHLFYVRKLDRLRNDPAAPIQIKEIKMAGGEAVLDRPVIGQPIFESVAPVTKSRIKYLADFKAVQDQIKGVSDQIEKMVKTEQALSLVLSGTDKKPGLYRLLDIEKEEQDRIKSEKEYVEPLWVSALREVDTYKVRQKRLETTLDKLRKFQERGKVK